MAAAGNTLNAWGLTSILGASGVAAVLSVAMQHSVAAIATAGLFRIFMSILIVVYETNVPSVVRNG
jgi:hypothetical protein